MARIERLINLVAALLETPRPLTADEIRERIHGYGDEPTSEAFRRAFERDKQELREMGVPIETVATDPFADQADGYIIPKGRYYLPEMELAPDEVAALRIAAESVLGGGDQASSGLLKLSMDAALTPSPGPRLVWGADVAANEPMLASMFAAVTASRVVRFGYVDAHGEGSSRTIEPYRLVHKRGHWYVVGRDIAREDVRSFKLSRIHADVEILPERFRIPDSFDPSSYLGGEAWEIGEETSTASIRFFPPMQWWPEQNMPQAEISENPDGTVEVRTPVANLDALVSWALGFGEAVEIMEPEDAGRRLLAHIEPFLGARR